MSVSPCIATFRSAALIAVSTFIVLLARFSNIGRAAVLVGNQSRRLPYVERTKRSVERDRLGVGRELRTRRQSEKPSPEFQPWLGVKSVHLKLQSLTLES